MRADVRVWVCVLAVSAVTLAGCGPSYDPLPDPAVTSRINSKPPALRAAATTPPAPPLDAEEAWVVYQHCTACHTLDCVTKARLDWDGWRGEVGHMVQNGAWLTPSEQQRIVDYLAWRW